MYVIHNVLRLCVITMPNECCVSLNILNKLIRTSFPLILSPDSEDLCFSNIVIPLSRLTYVQICCKQTVQNYTDLRFRPSNII